METHYVNNGQSPGRQILSRLEVTAVEDAGVTSSEKN
jgi:hypothetical protein